MALQLEVANVYFLKPVDALDPDYDPEQDYTEDQLLKYPDLLEDNILVVGSMYIMNEVAVYMTEEDVIATTGVAPDRCVIITSLGRERCKEIIKKGTDAFDKKTKKVLEAPYENA